MIAGFGKVPGQGADVASHHVVGVLDVAEVVPGGAQGARGLVPPEYQRVEVVTSRTDERELAEARATRVCCRRVGFQPVTVPRMQLVRPH